MYCIELQTVFYEYQNKNHKINTSFVSREGPKFFILISAESKMKNKIKTSLVSTEGPKVNKTAINFMIFILIFIENCL